GIVANMARPPKGGDIDQINALVAGEGDLAISNTYYFARMLSGDDDALKAKLAKCKVFFPNQKDRGTHVNVSGAGVATYAPNKDNAIKFLEYMISPEAQEIFAGANFEYPVRDGAEQAPIIASWGDFKEDAINVVELGRNNAEAVKIMDRAGWAEQSGPCFSSWSCLVRPSPLFFRHGRAWHDHDGDEADLLHAARHTKNFSPLITLSTILRSAWMPMPTRSSASV